MNRLDKLVRKNIRSLQPYSSARDEFKGESEVFLDANENPFGELNRYPDPLQKELKVALSQEKGVNANQLFIGNGSDEVIDLLFRIFCIPGKDNVISLSPSYGMYQVSADINDIEMRELQLDETFNFNSSDLLALTDDNSKIIFICSPNNPTGNTFELALIEEICQAFNGIVVVDEAYIDFATTPSTVSLITKNWNLVVSQTFSKARGLAAARVGYAIAQQEIIALFNKVKPPYNVSALNQRVALESLLDREKYISEINLLKSERERLKENLRQLSAVRKIYPSEANFLLVEFADGPQLYATLVEQKIITRNRNKQVRNCLRITVGTPEENNRLLTTLANYYNEKESTIY